jgi:hypothetical protein
MMTKTYRLVYAVTCQDYTHQLQMTERFQSPSQVFQTIADELNKKISIRPRHSLHR